ncbi:N-acetylglucosamine-6-phosphate deacetylase [Neobacillus notoginsengisoli]|uniref:N-acetylglucosamine-6-phosphate deacetylase n=2 Tax=Neobacillus notoginsengisoli TaxID=1578198 RepID=A0A417YSE3_9BACI|nr:N-acetylglucosamine-6-phosphate deacetylase [Neobacillus notoginsengisoli]
MLGTLLAIRGKAVFEKEVKTNQYVYIEGGKIVAAGPLSEMPAKYEQAEVVEIPNSHTVVPGFVDLHIHGAAGADTMDATPEALATMAEALPAEGTTAFLATTITQEHGNIDLALKNAAGYCKADNGPGKAEVVGVHLEGPFINTKRKGAQPEEYILDPDIELFSKWQESADGLIKLVTMAPELENGLEFVEYLDKNGVVASIGHTDAVYEEVEKAVKAGAKHVTHLYNGMRGMHHREPGTAGAALLFKELMVEMIVDGIHIAPKMVKLSVAAKGTDRLLLVTDSMRAKCLNAGVYDLGGQDVTVGDGKVVLADGTLAGSILKMNEAVRNVAKFSDLSLLDAVKMASENPARQIGIFGKKGSIAAGKDADLVVLDTGMNVVKTYCRGELAFQKS